MGGKILDLHSEKMIKKGKREGRKEGLHDGMLQATVKIITNMLKKKQPYADIAETTEVTIEEVERIAKEKGLAY